MKLSVRMFMKHLPSILIVSKAWNAYNGTHPGSRHTRQLESDLTHHNETVMPALTETFTHHIPRFSALNDEPVFITTDHTPGFVPPTIYTIPNMQFATDVAACTSGESQGFT